MKITNFIDSVRLGEYPSCVDVNRVGNLHSDYGVVVDAYCYGVRDEDPHLVLYKSSDSDGRYRLLVLQGVFNLEDKLKELGDVHEILFMKRGGKAL